MTPPANDYGHFVWLDLMSSEPPRAEAFYCELLGWRIEAVPVAGTAYHMFLAGETGIGGVMPLEAAPGMASHWRCYVSVADIEATSRAFTTHGGKVRVPKTPIPGHGAFAVLQDPHGAEISVFRSDEPHPPRGPADLQPGLPCWFELWARDPVGARAFYATTLAWSFGAQEMESIGVYHIARVGNEEIAGILQATTGNRPPYWCPYFLVQDLDETAARAVTLGAMQVAPPRDIPAVGRFSVQQDPTGALFALFQGNA